MQRTLTTASITAFSRRCVSCVGWNIWRRRTRWYECRRALWFCCRVQRQASAQCEPVLRSFPCRRRRRRRAAPTGDCPQPARSWRSSAGPRSVAKIHICQKSAQSCFLADRTYVTVELMVQLSVVCRPSLSVADALWLNGAR